MKGSSSSSSKDLTTRAELCWPATPRQRLWSEVKLADWYCVQETWWRYREGRWRRGSTKSLPDS